MQIEGATWGATNRLPNKGPRARQQFPLRKTPSHSFTAVHKSPRHMCELSKDGTAEPDLISFRIPIDHVFNAIKDQP